jgi:hypothetical protein
VHVELLPPHTPHASYDPYEISIKMLERGRKETSERREGEDIEAVAVVVPVQVTPEVEE